MTLSQAHAVQADNLIHGQTREVIVLELELMGLPEFPDAVCTDRTGQGCDCVAWTVRCHEHAEHDGSSYDLVSLAFCTSLLY